MSYRDYINEQRKLVQTKKEAREAKEDRLRNPRPPRLDPPPPRGGLMLPIIIGIILMTVMGLGMFLLYIPAIQPPADSTPTIIIQGTPEETELIRAWLEGEILASNLHWDIISVKGRQDLAVHINAGNRADVLIIEQELASELYEAGLLHPLLEKAELPSFNGAFSPLWEASPFTKNLGWVITTLGDVEYARHLYTVFQQFAEPFTFKNDIPHPS